MPMTQWKTEDLVTLRAFAKQFRRKVVGFANVRCITTSKFNYSKL